MSEKDSFHYTYSSQEHEEIIRIQKKYGIDPPEPSEREVSLEELRRIDRSTARPGMIAGLSVGIAGTLIMGTGMSMSMVWSDRLFVPGIVVGVIGIAAVIAAHPIYKAITNRNKERSAAKIRELTEKPAGKHE